MQEPALPGASGLYLDLGAGLDREALREELGPLRELSRAYKAEYAAAYGLLNAAATLLPENAPGLISPLLRERTERRAAALARRELGRGARLPSSGKTAEQPRKRFLSAVSCLGRVRFDGTLTAGGERLILVENGLGLGRVFADAFARTARELGWGVLAYLDPLEPEKTEALTVPGAGLSLLCTDGCDGAVEAAERCVRLDGRVLREQGPEARRDLLRREEESGRLLRQAVAALARAKALHDRLEAVYRPHVDFRWTEALAEEHIAALFG